MPFLSTDKDIFDIISFLLAIFGAAGSAILALRGRQWRLDLRAIAGPPFESIDLEIFNPAYRRITIRKCELRYGMSSRYSDHLVEVVSLENQMFEPGHGQPGKISISDLQQAVAQRGIKPKGFSRLWFVVTAYNGRSYSTMVVIDPSIIKAPYIPQAEIYIAADLVLGFPQSPSRMADHWKIK